MIWCRWHFVDTKGNKTSFVILRLPLLNRMQKVLCTMPGPSFPHPTLYIFHNFIFFTRVVLNQKIGQIGNPPTVLLHFHNFNMQSLTPNKWLFYWSFWQKKVILQTHWYPYELAKIGCVWSAIGKGHKKPSLWMFARRLYLTFASPSIAYPKPKLEPNNCWYI